MDFLVKFLHTLLRKHDMESDTLSGCGRIKYRYGKGLSPIAENPRKMPSF
jgi:hypothetical protein